MTTTIGQPPGFKPVEPDCSRRRFYFFWRGIGTVMAYRFNGGKPMRNCPGFVSRREKHEHAGHRSNPLPG